MYKHLRIFFTILSALCAAIALPAGTFFGFIGAILFALGAFAFFLIMLFFKQKQELQESKKNDNIEDTTPTE